MLFRSTLEAWNPRSLIMSLTSRMALLMLASLLLLGASCGTQASQPRRLQQALRCAAGQGVQTIRGSRVCAACPRGTWSAGGNNAACSACTSGTTTPGNGSTNAKACSLCVPGFGFAAGKCTACARGTYSAVTGNTPCVACATGYTTAGTGSNSVQSCRVCAAGYGAMTPNVCTLCAIGSWSSSSSGPCTACPSGQTTASTGATSKAACIKLVVPPARDVLLAAKQQLLGGAEPAPGRCEATISWTNKTDVCTWTGISCAADGSVVGIDLATQNCGGSIPQALSQLPSLRSLVLEANFLSGGIPSSWAALTKLSFLNLASNNMNSSLPGAEFATLPALASIMLTGNFLPGPLPAAWATMPALRDLSLDYNALSGSVPAEWGAPSAMLRLQTLAISDNPNLSGCFPRRLAERLGRRDVATDQEFIEGMLYNTGITSVCA